jgi:uncharacterized protein (UPF0276 family)
MSYSLASPISQNPCGIGLRFPHHTHVLNNQPQVDFFEIHGENYFNLNSKASRILTQIRKDYPISVHCVGASLGTCDDLDQNHLQKIKNLIDHIDPFIVSDHISWGQINDDTYNDLLPIPYNEESLRVICDHISFTQDFLNRQILVENPSTYLSFKNSTMSEEQFINKLVQKSGCKILLDVNNIYVSSENNNFDAKKYLENIDANIVGQFHLAGHYVKKIANNKQLIIDTHSSTVCDDVWELFKIAAKKFKNIPTLIEWDQDIPDFEILQQEKHKAQKIIANV